MKGLRTWWMALSDRERALLALMSALLGGVLLWLCVWRPVQDGLAGGRARYDAAAMVNASVRAKLHLLKTTRPAAREDVPLAQGVAASAAEVGLTLDRSQTQGDDGLAITIASARASALLAWLAGLEAHGVRVETISMAQGVTPGTLVVQAVLRRSAT